MLQEVYHVEKQTAGRAARRTEEGEAPKRPQLHAYLEPVEDTALERLRGLDSRSVFVRKLIRQAAEERGVPLEGG
jgi:hypothetical protein